MSDLVLRLFADELEWARVERAPIAPLSERGVHDIADAYAIQAYARSFRLAMGDRRVGWKIGLTNAVIQAQLGIDQPDFGALFASTFVEANDGPVVVALADFIAPRCEAELAFRLRRAIRSADMTPEEIFDSVGEVALAIEIVDSRVRDWKIKITDTIADNASHGAAIIGPFVPLPRPFHPEAFELSLASGEAELREKATAVVSPGEAVGPLGAIRWLGRTLLLLGEELQEGDVVLSGAVTPLLALEKPRRVVASASGLASIELEVR